jgi:hypothetical protein
MLVSLAQAGRLAPSRPEVLVALAQTLEVEHKRVDLLLKQKDVAGAIAALEACASSSGRPARPPARPPNSCATTSTAGSCACASTTRRSTPHARAARRHRPEGLGDDYKSLAVNAFTARLVALRGEVSELRGDDDAALAAYDEALTMNRGLLQQALAGAAR